MSEIGELFFESLGKFCIELFLKGRYIYKISCRNSQRKRKNPLEVSFNKKSDKKLGMLNFVGFVIKRLLWKKKILTINLDTIVL